MKLNFIYTFLLIVCANATFAQGSFEEAPEEEEIQTVDVHDRLRNWNLIDDFTFSDSTAIDTTLSGFQVDNDFWHKSFSNTYTGNTGSPFISNLLSEQDSYNEFIFVSGVKYFLTQPEDIVWFNTKTPYSVLSYKHGTPSRSKEENFTAFFSQNINKDWNFGAEFNTLSANGMYAGQNVDHRNFKFFSSYQGAKYSVHTAFLYNKLDYLENGGLANDTIDLGSITEFTEPENIPMKYNVDAFNSVKNTQFFLNQSFNIGRVNIVPNSPVVLDSLGNETSQVSMDNEAFTVPVSTIYHTFHYNSYSRKYTILDLTTKYNDDGEIPLYGKDIFIDGTTTGDSTRYTLYKNTFQIKFNEEANSLLRFGLRGYISNEIKHYSMPTDPDSTLIEDSNDYELIYRYQNETLVTSYFGGQLFKNLGENFWWNTDARLYFQGYKAGDIHVSGEINSLYKVFKDTAGIYAKGNLDLRSAEYFEENYYSNHFQWSENFKQEKSIDVEVGVNIPTRRFKLSWQSKTITDLIYWNDVAKPEQFSGVISTFQFSLLKNFKAGPFHSDNKLAYQYSSNQDIYPVPDFAAFSSNYLNFYLANRVLQIQFGVDVRYHSAFYAKAYMPATGQFHVQNIDDREKVGNYPFIDVFVNMHLKRANFFIKADHVNEGLMEKNYFVAPGYAYQQFRLKYGVSWRFYD